MVSLKEVKTRIASVSSTKKITQARQMVSSAQLHHAQGVLENAEKYKEALDRMFADLSADSNLHDFPLVRKQPAGAVAVIILSSNSGMCGAFNANMVKMLGTLKTYYPGDELLLFPIGKKIREAVEHAGFTLGFENAENAGKEGNLDPLADKASVAAVSELITRLVTLYRNQKIKQADVIYYHYENRAIQEIREMTLLPFPLPADGERSESTTDEDYIYEPSKEKLIEEMIPMLLKSNLYYALVENQTSEHAARTMAMQLATENADEILADLQLTYNKLRQQNITSELLDIIGSSFA